MSNAKITPIPTKLNMLDALGDPAIEKYNVLVLDVTSDEFIEEQTKLTLYKASELVRKYHNNNASILTFTKLILKGPENDFSTCIILYPPNNPVELWVSTI